MYPFIKIHRHHLYVFGIIIWMGLLVGCAIWQSQRRFGSTKEEIVFSHKRHAEMDILCVECHVDTSHSEFASDNNVPQEKDCMVCHKRTQGCELCHGDVKNAVRVTPVPYRVKFSHKRHLQLQREPAVVCTTCHLTIAQSESVADTDEPRMKVCHQCHDVTQEDCTTCHQNMSADVTLRPASHDALWLGRHRNQAPQDDELCAQCHRGKIRATGKAQPVDPAHSQVAQARFCSECHRGDIWQEEVHENNYIQSHRLDASANSKTCQTCHERQECQQCHAARDWGYEEVHPAGFVFEHGREAKRALTSCTACHKEDDCLGCHSTISPHPQGWERDITSNNEHLCLKCHTKGEL